MRLVALGPRYLSRSHCQASACIACRAVWRNLVSWQTTTCINDLLVRLYMCIACASFPIERVLCTARLFVRGWLEVAGLYQNEHRLHLCCFISLAGGHAASKIHRN